MEGAGILTLLAAFLVVPFQMWAESQQKWRMLDPVEQNLRRASQGFALVVFVLLAVFYLYGVSGVAGFFVNLVTNPGQAWPAAVFFGGLIAYGLVRFLVGARRLAGVRDGLRTASALVKLALGLAVTLYLWRTYPWGQLVASAWGFYGLALVFAVALWNVLTGAVRVAVLSWPRGSAYELVSGHIEQEEFTWDDDDASRHWWQFWKRPRG